MADVFVSYKKSDADRVRPLVDQMRAAGLDVWWDEAIQPSTSWRAEIAKQLGAAKCVVAVWTEDRVNPEGGQWVMEEASHGQARKALAPVRLDLVSPPLGFGETQYADLAAWSGSADDPRLQHFLDVVRALVAAGPMPSAPRPTHFEAPGIKLQNVRMENVSIQVGVGGAGTGQEVDADAERTEADAPRLHARERASFSPSMLLAKAVGVIFPLVAIVFFVLTMGDMACDQGNAPDAACRVLATITGK